MDHRLQQGRRCRRCGREPGSVRRRGHHHPGQALQNVVGVNHIRELAGAMEEKKAGRGILVTTSWFTSGGRQKAYEHGRMQFVDGQNLIFLIKKYTGKDVVIVISVKRPKNAASIDQPDLPED
ncbi:restriction endonuclease [Actinoplanes sp. NPDC026619]|uniref:restriction endonuclease n=1 Tax=Actinoplanes sp. NPDC026619 TaxID=3155798 RepID=UPI0033D4D83C